MLAVRKHKFLTHSQIPIYLTIFLILIVKRWLRPFKNISISNLRSLVSIPHSLMFSILNLPKIKASTEQRWPILNHLTDNYDFWNWIKEKNLRCLEYFKLIFLSMTAKSHLKVIFPLIGLSAKLQPLYITWTINLLTYTYIPNENIYITSPMLFKCKNIPLHPKDKVTVN